MGNTHPLWIAIGAMLFMWVAIFTAISHLGGWAALANEYRCQESFTGRRWYFQKGQMRWMVGYNNCLTVGADPSGLFISILFLFRIAHPPLFIPWRDITYVSKKFLWIPYVEFRLGRNLNIPLRVSLPLADKMKAAAASSWPIEAVA